MGIKWKTPRKRLVAGVMAILLLPVLGWWVLLQMSLVAPPGQPLNPPFNLSDRLATLQIETGDGGSRVVFSGKGGTTIMAAEEFLSEVSRRQEERRRWGWLFRKLDITGWASLAWVGFGFMAQGVFMSRMLVQWYVSEKARTSVVPPVFWWLSLLGAAMLIVYYLWRKDPVSLLAQSFGFIVYLRNLWFLHEAKRRIGEGGE